MSAIADLLDINVWLALAFEGHPQHNETRLAWDEFKRPSFCRLTQLGLVRLLCNTHVMGNQVLEPEKAWETYQQLIRGGTAEFLNDPIGLDERLKQFTKGAKASRDFWSDAYLAAFARCAGMRLVSFDSGFARYKDLDFLQLGTGQ